MNGTNLDLVIKNIASSIQNNYNPDYIGLTSGKAGIALFLSYYSYLYNDDNSGEKAAELLSSSLDNINAGYNSSLYSAGITGLAWVLAFMHNNEQLAISEIESFMLIEEHISKKLGESLHDFEYDYLHGGMGYAMYFIERYQEKIDQNLIRRITETFMQKSIRISDNEIAWNQTYMNKKDENVINLGLAHGVPSILIIMAKLYDIANEENKGRLKELITKGANYIITQKSHFQENNSFFPYSNINKSQSRLAWCYGDLGVAYSLLKVGEALGSESLKKEAINILLSSTKRRELDINKIVDAGICHGTAGIMQIYGNLYRETKLQEFKQTNEYWLSQTLKLSNEKNYIGGFKFWNYNNLNETLEWESNSGLLTGIAGVGLSLLSYVDDYKYKWDKCLLLGL